MQITLSIPGYELAEVIHEGTSTVLYRATEQASQKPVILKVLKAESPTLEELTQLKHEYKVAEQLNIEGVVRVYQLIPLQNRLALVCEDFGGQSLKQLLAGQPLGVLVFLKLAVQLAQALAALHQHHIIHKDLKPANIIINPQTEQVKLTDFSIASQLSKETPQLVNPHQLEGSLPYMSPEQTGRMNRTVDYRSDFYSLGVTFYEMLTGQLPFQSHDPLELVHSHIAKQPVPIQQLNASVPTVVGAIALKLMAKNAEDRYQSAEGLLVDLQTCLDQYQSQGTIKDFVPGQLDILSQLLIPQKLYGREREVAMLLAAFERVAGSGSAVKATDTPLGVAPSEKSVGGDRLSSPPIAAAELLLVSGYSGIGKSSVVNEVNKPITRQQGYFISGKFDQFKRHIPYASLIQAFSSLMRQLLTESDDRLQSWRTKLLGALGSNGQIIIDVIPELERILGKQPPVPQLGTTESENRFNWVFQDFIRVFTQKAHPLVLFLDDLQWADAATLKLISLLLSNPDSRHLLVIGAYRDHEVSPTHPLIQTVQAIQKAGTVVTHIVLQPLTLPSVTQLLAETLHDTRRVQPLAQLIWNQTGGNPFFLTQLLYTLEQENVLTFDFNTASWEWDVTAIETIGVPDQGVVELLVRRLTKLPPATQEVLKLAACIGDRFSLNILSMVHETSIFQTATDLYAALKAGFIVPLNKAYKIPMALDDADSIALTLIEQEQPLRSSVASIHYRFLHDRVQQAAYSLIPAAQKKTVHRKIGYLMLSNLKREDIEANIFDIVNQLNVGIDSTTELVDRDTLAELNLIAGQRAQAAIAYQAATRYLDIGLGLLSEDCWQRCYDLALKLHSTAVEVEFANTNFDRAESLARIVLQQAKHSLDKAKIHYIKTHLYGIQQQPQKAIDVALEATAVLGITLSSAIADALKLQQVDAATDADGSKSAGETLTSGAIDFDRLEQLPEMTDPHKLAAMDILTAVTPPAYFTDFDALNRVVVTQVNLSLAGGNCPQSAAAYIWYGAILCGAIGDIETGYQFGQLGLKLLHKYGAKALEPIVYNLMAANVIHWKEHAQETLTYLRLGIQRGMEVGDFAWAGYTVTEFSHQSFWVGSSLEAVATEQKQYISLLVQLKQETLLPYAAVWQQLVLNLQDLSADQWQLIGEAYNEVAMLPVLQQTNNRASLCCLYLAKTVLYFLLADYAHAVETARLAAAHTEVVVGSMLVSAHNFYYSLSLLAHCDVVELSEQARYLQQVGVNQKIMGRWANHAPMNFQHKFDLVEAERCRIEGQNQEAMRLYDRAIRGATEHGYLQEAAIANERAGQFCLSLERERLAKTYLTDAYYGYIQWGAMAKVKALSNRYPTLITPDSTSNPVRPSTTTTTSQTTTSNPGSNLDLNTVIKAAEAIASEIRLDRLLEKYLQIVLENAAAQKGCLLLLQNDQLLIEAFVADPADPVIVLQAVPAVTSPDLPLSVINYVLRTQKPIVLSDASEAEGMRTEYTGENSGILLQNPSCMLDFSTFQADPYIVQYQPKSMLCAPVFYQGQVTGVIYLENAIASGAFTPDRLELLKLLTAQAAIAIENARLYASEQERSQQLQASFQQLQQTQAQLVQTEKISSLGQLVAGVAHEVNNPVGFIAGNLNHASQYIGDLIHHLRLYEQHCPMPPAAIVEDAEAIDLEFLLEDLPKMVSSMQMGTDRIRDIMQSLRNFSRSDGANKRLTDIHQGIESTLMILQHRLKARETRPAIQVVKQYGDLPPIPCYAGQLNQVFMNLLANAIDALEEGNQGKAYSAIEKVPNCITIQTEFISGSMGDRDTPPPMHDAPSATHHAIIRIADNGLGMSETVRQHLFDPFFTTKPEGKGTGLGLSISHQIVVEKHNGSLTCHSTPGVGTEFVLDLPVAANEMQERET